MAGRHFRRPEVSESGHFVSGKCPHADARAYARAVECWPVGSPTGADAPPGSGLTATRIAIAFIATQIATVATVSAFDISLLLLASQPLLSTSRARQKKRDISAIFGAGNGVESTL